MGRDTECWKDSVKLAKMRAGQNPDSFVMLKSDLYKEALVTYMFKKESNKNSGNSMSITNSRNKNLPRS